MKPAKPTRKERQWFNEEIEAGRKAGEKLRAWISEQMESCSLDDGCMPAREVVTMAALVDKLQSGGRSWYLAVMNLAVIPDEKIGYVSSFIRTAAEK